MPNVLFERPAKIAAQASTDGTAKKIVSRRKPPGQRLLIYAAISCLIACTQVSSMKFGQSATQPASIATANVAPPIALVYPLDELKKKVETASALKNLRAGVFVADLKTGKYLDYNGHEEYAAASMIKIPIYVALMQAVDNHQVNLDQPVQIRQDLITGGSGWLQWRPAGTMVPLKDVAELMIIVSDNTATNMIIDLLGGKEKLDRDFVSWGLERTRINNMLGDFEGTNKTSPYDMVYLFGRIDRGELISKQSRDLMYRTMERTRIRTLLPPGLAPVRRFSIRLAISA